MNRKIDKAEFVKLVGSVLRAADMGVSKAELRDEDTAEITYRSGMTQLVDIARDNRLEIIKDIVKAVC